MIPTDPENVDMADVDTAVDLDRVLSVDCPRLIFDINTNKDTSK